jgi:alpha-D-ribose 1-methylphosphonate 5-triphosphate synthase subunit PhnI
MYVAVKGGERAIANAHALLSKQGRGDPLLPRIEPAAVAGQLGVLVSRVMTEGSLYDPELAARAILQAQGDALEAITLVRSYRTTLPRFGYTRPVDTDGLPPQRRISATFKDLPGGQQLTPPSTTPTGCWPTGTPRARRPMTRTASKRRCRA